MVRFHRMPSLVVRMGRICILGVRSMRVRSFPARWSARTVSAMWRGVVSRTRRLSTRCCAILAECLYRARAVRSRPPPCRPVKRRTGNRCSLGASTTRVR
uniref:Putative secreted protein n=1 Tax=Anopheles triannulatus TaxID=58253 RepID=A0A2M4B1K3_9DIPT